MPDTAHTLTPAHRRLLVAAASVTFLLVVMGGTVCVTGSTLGCPDWPACYGRLVPPPRADSIIEYTHRFLALLAAPLVLAAAAVGWWRARDVPWVARPPMAALGLFLVVAAFGAFAVLTGLPPLLAALDLGSALLALALLIIAAVAARHVSRGGGGPRLSLDRPLARVAGATTLATLLVLVLGVLVAQPGSIARCLGWPLYGGQTVAATTGGVLQSARVALSVVALLGMGGLGVGAWRRRAGDATPAWMAAGLLMLTAAELAVGAWLPRGEPTAFALVLYVALAAGVWAALVAATARLALAAPAGDRQPVGR